MVRFEHSRERKGKRDTRERSPDRGPRSSRSFKDGPEGRRDSRDRRGFGDSSGRRSSGREFRNRGNLEMTKVICSECKKECEVPFKPTSNKPVYCSDCFKNKGSSNNSSNSDFDMINEKLNKIMKALKIE